MKVDEFLRPAEHLRERQLAAQYHVAEHHAPAGAHHPRTFRQQHIFPRHEMRGFEHPDSSKDHPGIRYSSVGDREGNAVRATPLLHATLRFLDTAPARGDTRDPTSVPFGERTGGIPDAQPTSRTDMSGPIAPLSAIRVVRLSVATSSGSLSARKYPNENLRRAGIATRS